MSVIEILPKCYWLYVILNISQIKAQMDCTKGVIPLSGAGSESAFGAYQTIGSAYVAERTRISRIVDFSYARLNSRKGIQKVIDNEKNGPIFGASEITFNSTEKELYKNLLHIPVIGEALAILFNLPETNQLNLTLQVIADMFLGKITRWNHNDLKVLNPSIVLPNERILLVVRQDGGSGETYVFTMALSKISEEWKTKYGAFYDPLFSGKGCCNSTIWPRNLIAFYGNTANGLTGIISSIPYTIGYASLANALLSGTVLASIYNREGLLTYPSVDGVQAAIEYYQKEEFDKLRVPKSISEFDVILAGGNKSYPIGTLSYIVLNRTTSPGVSCCSMEELVGLIELLLSANSSTVISRNNLIPLPMSLVEYIKNNLLPAVTCNSKSVYENYLFSIAALNDNSLKPWQLALICTSVAVIFVIIFMVIFTKYQNHKRKGNDMVWLLKGSEFKQKEVEPDSRSHSRHQQSLADNTNDTFATKLYWAKNECDVNLSPLHLNHCSRWDQKTKRLVFVFTREFQQTNLVSLLGVTITDGIPHLVNPSCSKGTLHRCLQNSPYEITTDMKYCLACNVVEGLRFLHKKNIAHGLLSSASCYVDANWTVKICGWEMYTIYFIEDTQKLGVLTFFDSEAPLESNAKLIQYIYRDPELVAPYTMTPFQSDVFSFGMLLFEIFTQNLPYHWDVMNNGTYMDVLRQKFSHQDLVPHIPAESMPEKVYLLAVHCLRSTNERPTISTIQTNLSRGRSTKHGIIDIVMGSMENCIMDRTSKLLAVTTRMEELLNAVLPTQIASKLLNGETVAPELYENVTIFFSDIVGFTTISARSTPLEVMNFLNNIWVVFDQTIDMFDVYKVDTIGDAYMVSSGLPNRNGIHHSKNIADLALQLMVESMKIKISHLNDENLKVRMGFNSGPVTAGVIGHKMPQYCVFGDTVNTASRMESTSLPSKIQISESSYKLLSKDFKEFQFEFRGEIEVKGKGKMKTYWLLEKSLNSSDHLIPIDKCIQRLSN